MLGNIRKLKLSASELPLLRNRLTPSDVQEFDRKYGHLLDQIREENEKKYAEWQEDQKKDHEKHAKKRVEERERREEERKANNERTSNIMKSLENTTRKINEYFDKTIDANQKAKIDLEKQLSLDDFYKYYNSETQTEADISVQFAKSFMSKIESFGCDPHEYLEDVKSHYIKLLETHPDKRVVMVSSVFASIEKAERDE